MWVSQVSTDVPTSVDNMDRFTGAVLSDMLTYFDNPSLPPLDSVIASQPYQQDLCSPSPLAAAPKISATPTCTPCGGLPGSHASFNSFQDGPAGTPLSPSPPLMASSDDVVCTMPPQPFPAQASSHSQQPVTSQANKEVKVSHSSIEKCRRDRINALIDELRHLVPAATSPRRSTYAGTDRRPKHVVLSDTITLLKLLQQRDEHDQQQLQQLKQLVAASNSTSSSSGATANAAAAAAEFTCISSVCTQPELQHALSVPMHSAAGPCASAATTGPFPAAGAAATAPAVLLGSPTASPKLPKAPTQLPRSFGVSVEEGAGCFLVKVSCMDRQGLLEDLTIALRELQLQVTRAAITTSEVGAVYDVFEVVSEAADGLEAVTAFDIQVRVHQALWRKQDSGRRNVHATAPAAALRVTGQHQDESHMASCAFSARNDNNSRYNEVKRRCY